MGSTQSSQIDSNRTLRGGVLADYETIYNYFEERGENEASPNRQKSSKQKSSVRKKNTDSNHAENQNRKYQQSRSLYEETLSYGGDSCYEDKNHYQRGKKRLVSSSGEHQVHFKTHTKLRTQKQINAELMARNAENQLKEMELKKYTERLTKSRRSKSLNQNQAEAKQQPIQLDNQSAEYWQKRRQIERVLKSEEAVQAAERKQRKQKKRDMRSMEDNRGIREKSAETIGGGGERVRRKKDRSRNTEEIRQDDRATSSSNQHSDDKSFGNKRDGRSTQSTHNNERSGNKSRSRSAKSDHSGKNTSGSNVKTEAELLEELRQDDDKPTKTERRELVSQHVPHYALPTKKMELKTDGRLSKLYVPKKVMQQHSTGEWPEDLDKDYCKMVIDTFKDMYSDLINDPNWVYNQRKTYLNFLNTAEWQEMDLKLAKMSFQQLQEEPLRKMTSY